MYKYTYIYVHVYHHMLLYVSLVDFHNYSCACSLTRRVQMVDSISADCNLEIDEYIERLQEIAPKLEDLARASKAINHCLKVHKWVWTTACSKSYQGRLNTDCISQHPSYGLVVGCMCVDLCAFCEANLLGTPSYVLDLLGPSPCGHRAHEGPAH